MSYLRSLPLVALVLAAAVIVGHAGVLLGGRTWDDVRYHTEVTPPRLAAAQAVQSGELPAWWEGTGLGVPLAAEPSHGALYPPTWLAASPRSFDWLQIVHLAWAALGVAVWARGRLRDPRVTEDEADAERAEVSGRRLRSVASDQGALVAGVLVAMTGLLASAGLRGALPALAHLPWIAVAALALANADDVRARTRATVALAALIGLVALTGMFGALIDALVLAIALAAPVPRRRARARVPTIVLEKRAGSHDGHDERARVRGTERKGTCPHLFVAVLAGLAIGAVQWLPALLQLGRGAGSSVHALPLSRLVELIVPGSFGATDASRAVSALAGASAWAPSVFVGAPLLALAAVRTPSWRVLGALGGLVVLVLVAGRGGWPAWLGAPELHLGALVLVLAALAGGGVDDLLAGQRRAIRALAVAAGCTLVALIALAVLRGKHPAEASALGRALVEGGLGLACTLGALGVAWHQARQAREGGAALLRAIALALLVLPSIASMPAVAPTVDRALVTEAPPFVVALEEAPRPLRAYRMAPRPVSAIDAPETVADAMATFGGGSAWRWGIIGARSEDPARPVEHDQTWRAAANEGGALLDRFGIGIAILPSSVADSRAQRGMTVLARRGDVAMVSLPVAPIAAVMRSWQWAVAPEDARALMFAIGGGTNVQRGTVVLQGAGATSTPGTRSPEPCTIERWAAGDLALRCHASAPGYAVVSSTPSPGWSVTVDGEPTPWLTADVLRRAVAVPAGDHVVHWTYATPGLPLGLLLAALGVLALGVLVVVVRRRAPSPDDAAAN